jgi:multicomponent Na+:H+ antiporter subunit E
MSVFLENLLLALIWAAASGRFTFENVIVGFGIGYVALWLARRALGPSNYFAKLRLALGFVLFFVWQLILANLRVAYDVVTPAHRARPGVIAIPLEAQSDLEITLLANVITLTPGTLSLDVSDDRKVLYIHAMFIDAPEALRDNIKNGFERRLLELLR